MSGLLKYAIVLALGVVIGAYVFAGPLSLDDIFPVTHAAREAALVPVEPARPTTPASIDEELDYMVAKQLASLEGWRAFLGAHANGAYAQAAEAEVRRRLGANGASIEPPATAPASEPTGEDRGAGIAQQLGSLPADEQSATAEVEPRLPVDKAPAPPNREVPGGAPSNASAASEPTDPVSFSSRDAAPAADAMAVRNDASADAKAVNEAALPASSLAGPDVASAMSDETCRRDEDRLARLRSNPSGEEARRFDSELTCETLRPELQQLVKSLGSAAPAPSVQTNLSPLMDSALAQLCEGERAALDRLRQEPSAEAAGLFWRDLKCEGLRPQVRLLLESLNVTPESVGAAPAQHEQGAGESAASGAQTAKGTDPVACRRETAELSRIRATPDLGDAERFASAVTCQALKPQTARLLDSLRQ